MRAPAQRRLTMRALADVLAELPEIVPLEAGALGEVDLLICVLGFEDRCLAVPRALADANARASAAAICRYPTNHADNERNEPELRGCLKRIAPTPAQELHIDGDFAEQLRELLAALGHRGSPPRVLLDVSVASNGLIIRALAALLESDVELHLLYAEAEHYRPTRDEHESAIGGSRASGKGELASGVLEVGVAGEFHGKHSSLLPHRVAVFPGFDRDRVRAAISLVDNDFITDLGDAPLDWMIGEPPHAEDAWRKDALSALHGVPELHPVHAVSTFDYREAMCALEEVHRRYGLQSNLWVVPLGSKMQAVGITLFCVARSEVAVVVSQPREYRAVAYSSGCRALWHLPLGPTKGVTRSLRRIDTLRLEPLDGPSPAPQQSA